MTYHIHASTRDGHYLGCVTTWGAAPTLVLAWVGSMWLRGLRLEIERPVRRPK